jgi:hypothetical protein
MLPGAVTLGYSANSQGARKAADLRDHRLHDAAS